MNKKIQRRNFLKAISLLSLSPLIQSCESAFSPGVSTGNYDRPTRANVDILLEGTEEEIASKFLNKHEVIQTLYENPGTELKIGFLEDRKYNVLKISFVKDNLASYKHLRLVNTNTGERANILWGTDGVYPLIKFVDDSGNIIIKNGKELEFPLRLSGQLNKVKSPSDWIVIGFKIFGVALLLWIGFSVAKYILAALAFISFNALAIGLVLAGVGIFIQLIKWILDLTGITYEDVVAFFVMAVNSLVQTLIDVVNYILSYVG